jgi:hypothetical protein
MTAASATTQNRPAVKVVRVPELVAVTKRLAAAPA